MGNTLGNCGQMLDLTQPEIEAAARQVCARAVDADADNTGGSPVRDRENGYYDALTRVRVTAQRDPETPPVGAVGVVRVVFADPDRYWRYVVDVEGRGEVPMRADEVEKVEGP